MGIDAAAKRIAEADGPGERRGRERMRTAVDGCSDYKRMRDLPGPDRTTRLSPSLHFGTISARELETLIAAKRSEGAKALRRQVCWRDFYLNVIRNFPGNRTEEYDERFRGMRWNDDPESLAAWKEGRTGVPWIDAGMRQLLAEGWMHNRVRMAVASYLTKNLLIDWREGEAHFMHHLLDGDESQNNGNWQWSASTGVDPQPYFRIFNPIRQQKRFDPDGEYVRRWVPEVRELPGRASRNALGGAGGGAEGGRVRGRGRLPRAAGRPLRVPRRGPRPLRRSARLGLSRGVPETRFPSHDRYEARRRQRTHTLRDRPSDQRQRHALAGKWPRPRPCRSRCPQWASR